MKLKAILLSLLSFAVYAGAQTVNTLPTLSRNNVWTGTNTYTQGKLVLGPSGQSCSTGSFMTGFSNTFTPVCQVVSGVSGVNSLNGLTGTLVLSQGTNITIVQTDSTHLTINASGSGGGGGSGTVSSGGSYNVAQYSNSSSITVQPNTAFSVIPPSLTTTQLSTLIAAFSSPTSLVIPNGYPEGQFTNTNTNGVLINDLRLGKSYVQASGFGLACDARQVTAQTTASSTTISITGASSADVGKTLIFTGTISGQQASFVPTIVSVSGTTAVISVAAPFTSTNPSNHVTIGTDNTAVIQNAFEVVSSNEALMFPANCSVLTHAISWDHGQTVVGQSGNQLMSFIGFPGEDVFLQKDISGGGFMGADGSAMQNFQVWVSGELDATQPIVKVDAGGAQTTFAGFYRPAAPLTAASNNPLSPGWAIGATNGVANTVQNSAVICVPTALGRLPVTGQKIVFPNLPGVFTSTVSSTAGSCSAGLSPVTMAAALPNTTGYTATQTEWVSTSNVQTIATAIPTTVTYPFTMTLNNSNAYQAGYESNFASHGRVKVGIYEFDYVGAAVVSPYSIRLVDGPATTTGIATGATIVPENPCPTAYEFPWPVIPDLNTNDSTPSGAQYFPAFCVGNAAFALPTRNAYTYSANSGFYNSTISNINVKNWPPFDYPGGQNNNAAWYFAGNNKPYSSNFNQLKMYGLAFGLVQGPASVGQHNIAQFGPTGDGNVYNNCSIHAGYPLIFDDFQNGTITGCDTYTSAYAAPNSTDHIGSATGLMMIGTTDETTGGPITSTYNITVNGWSSEPENGSHNEIPVYAEIDCVACVFTGNNFEGVPTVIGGFGNLFQGGEINVPAVNYGTNTTIRDVDNTVVNAIGTQAVGILTNSIINWGKEFNMSAPFGNASAAGPKLWNSNFVRGSSDGQTQDYAYQGNYTAPMVDPKGSMIYPDEFVQFNSGYAGPQMNIAVAYDPTSKPSGESIGCSLSGGCFTANFDGSSLILIGNQQRIPADLTMMEVSVKSVSSATSVGLQVQAGAQTGCSAATLFNNSIPVTASWTTYEALVDFTGKDACNLQFLIQNPSSGVLFGHFNFLQMPSRYILRTHTYTGGAACAVNGSLLGTDGSNVYWCEGNIVLAQPMVGGGGGGTTTPGGSSGAIQYNNSNAFGGLSGTGLVKANGTSAPTIATAGTDYVIPTGNITGTAAGLSGTPALPNGTTATTQATSDNTTKVATTAWVKSLGITNPMTTLGDTIYGGASGAQTRLPGSISSTAVILSQTGTGSVSAAPVWLGTTGTGLGVLQTSPALITPAIGAATGTSLVLAGPITGISGLGSATYTLGATAQVGTSATSPACVTNFNCDSLSGTFTFTSGTGSLTAGTIVTVTLPGTRGSSGTFNAPTCQVTLAQASGTATNFGVSAVPVNTSGTVTIPIKVYTALQPSVLYTLTYGVCGGV